MSFLRFLKRLTPISDRMDDVHCNQHNTRSMNNRGRVANGVANAPTRATAILI
jgi:hypothetical protein